MNCKYCNGEIVYPNGVDGERVCNRCGTVIEQRTPSRNYTPWAPEWHSNWNEEDTESIKEWLTVLRAVSCQLNVPNFPFREEAARTLRHNKELVSKSQRLSKNKRATIAGLIHLTLKMYNKTRPVKEISKELSLDHKVVLKQTWLLGKILNSSKKPPVVKRKFAKDYLHQYASLVTNNKDLLKNAEKILEMKKFGGNPIGLAAGALYHACRINKEKITKERIGEIFCISARTVYVNEAKIRRLYKTA